MSHAPASPSLLRALAALLLAAGAAAPLFAQGGAGTGASAGGTTRPAGQQQQQPSPFAKPGLFVYMGGAQTSSPEQAPAGATLPANVLGDKGSAFDAASFVQTLSNRPGTLNQVDARGRTGLHWAAIQGDAGRARMLVGAGASVQIADNDGMTPLHQAANARQLEIAQLLVEKGADVNQKNAKGQTPLHIAAFRGDKKLVEFLLEKKARLDAKDAEGKTPVDMASTGRHYDLWYDLRDRAEKGSAPAAPGTTVRLNLEG